MENSGITIRLSKWQATILSGLLSSLMLLIGGAAISKLTGIDAKLYELDQKAIRMEAWKNTLDDPSSPFRSAMPRGEAEARERTLLATVEQLRIRVELMQHDLDNRARYKP